jgi:serine/threonine protein kinase
MAVLEIGRIIGGQYKIVDVLGQGGMAEVYLALDLILDRNVALKVLRPEYLTDPQYVQRLQREAQTLARNTHPNIAAIYAFGEDKGLHYIVMEYVEGETLRARIDRVGKLPIGEAIAIAMEVIKALEYAHHKGIIHRDITPGNILITKDGNVKVVDFGIAINEAQTRLTAPGLPIGTAHYMSPEQVEGKEEITFSSDIYSLGTVLYEMLTGRPPFQANNPSAVQVKHLHETPRPPSSLRSEVPEKLDVIVLNALEKSPMSRFRVAGQISPASIAEMYNALLDLVGHSEAATIVGKRTESPLQNQSPRQDGGKIRKGIERTKESLEGNEKWLAALASILVIIGFIWTLFSKPIDPTPKSTPTVISNLLLVATSTPRPVTAEEEAFVRQALTNTRQMATFHATYNGDRLAFIDDKDDEKVLINIEGDFVSVEGRALTFHNSYIKGVRHGTSIEGLYHPVDGPGSYVRDSSGNWRSADSDESVSLEADTITYSVLGLLTWSCTDFVALPDEVSGETRLRHFLYRIDPVIWIVADSSFWSIDKLDRDTEKEEALKALLPSPSMGGQIWIDAEANIHRITFSGDLSIIDRAKREVSSEGTPILAIPGRIRSFTVTFSHHNDASVTLPVPVQAYESATAETVGETATSIAIETKVADERNETATAVSAQATATAQSAQKTLDELRAKAVQVYGPVSIDIPHKKNGTIEMDGPVGMNLRNFIAEARFRNPETALDTGWDYGILFRHTNDVRVYRLYFSSLRRWDYSFEAHFADKHADIRSLAGGDLPNLDVSPAGINHVLLAVNDISALLYVNGIYVATLGVSEHNVPGDVFLATDFISDNADIGPIIHYSDFRLWKLP